LILFLPDAMIHNLSPFFSFLVDFAFYCRTAVMLVSMHLVKSLADIDTGVKRFVSSEDNISG